MTSRAWLVRAVALLLVGAVALHQLRFVFGYGRRASEVLALGGHSYIPLAEALVAVMLGVASLWFLRSLVLAQRGRVVDEGTPSFPRLWTFASSALLAVYMLQEGFEGEFSAGHPSGLMGIFGHGGWTALPLALAIGALIALLLEGARRAIVFVSSRVRRPLPRLRRARWRHLPVGFPKLDGLAQNLAARAPPASS